MSDLKTSPEENASATEAKTVFQSTLDDLAAIGGFSNHISMALFGLPTDRRGAYQSMIHAQMCAHCRSIGAISESSMFDHSGIISLARMVIDGMTMYFYLGETIDNEDWDLRLIVLKLHDTVARIKLLRAYPLAKTEDLRTGRETLVQEMKINPSFQKLGVEQQKKLLSGNDIFVGGMRRAAHAAGWREESFTALYNYFSEHVHCAPMSFMRMREHKIDFLDPGEAQYGSAAFAISTAIACMRRVSLHHLWGW